MKNYSHLIFKKFCWASLLFLLAHVNVFATDYFLDPSGNDSNNGTSQTTPWQTLNKVNNTNFLPGDRLLLKAGSIWDGQLWPKGSGADGSPIIIDQYGTGNKPIINGQGTNYPQTLVSGAVMLYNQSYWEINNLEVTNYSTTVTSARAGMLIISVSSTIQNHIYIKDCYVHDVNSDVNGNKNTGGIIFFGSSTDKDGNSINVNSGFNDVLVENCRVFNVTKEGIRNKSDNRGAYPRVNSNIVFRNNHIEQVFGDGIVLAEIFKGGLVEHNFVKNAAMTNSANYAGIWTHYSTGSIIQFNEVCDMTGGYNDGEAFDADNNCDGDIFQYNYSHNNTGGFFLMMPSAKNIIIRYNISQNDGNGKELFHYTSNTYTSNYIYNNTFYIGAGKSTTLFKDGNATRTVKFFNNIIKVDGTITKFADNPFSASSYFANNCFYPANITAINGPSSHPGVINQDPKLIDPTTTTYGLNNIEGFKLQAGSPLINAGININNNGGRDYINTPLYISDQADIGAIEYPIITSVPPAPSLGGLVPIADAYVRNGTYANDNFGSLGTLSVKKDATSYERETFLKFDLSTLTEPPTAGKLKLYIDFGDTDVATNTWKIYYVPNDNWQESNITWNNKPSSETTELASVNGASAGNTIIFDIFNQVLSEYNGDKILSLKIISTVSGSKTNVEFGSKENPISIAAPLLVYNTETLPVTLENFTAKANTGLVALKWNTKSERNVSHFNITKSIDGNIFSKIGEVKALGKPNTYFYTDFHPVKGVNYYQLISQDYDGKTQKSDIIDAKLNTTNLSLNISKISGDIVNLAIEIPQATVASIVIADMMGKKVGELNTQLTPGTNTISVPSKAKGLLIASLFTPVANISKKFVRF